MLPSAGGWLGLWSWESISEVTFLVLPFLLGL